MPPRKKTPTTEIALPEDSENPYSNADVAALIKIAATSDPKEFQAEMGKALRRLATAGLKTIQPPKNIRELAALNDMIRKMEGLEDKKGDALLTGFFAPMRNVTRGPVGLPEVPTTTDPLADFEP